MKVGERYKVRVKIKLHTQPVRYLEYEKDGVFCKETASCYVFEDFRVRKSNVLDIVRRDGNEPK
jgi:hypothetical protein